MGVLAGLPVVDGTDAAFVGVLVLLGSSLVGKIEVHQDTFNRQD
jgi:hypothetical protein